MGLPQFEYLHGEQSTSERQQQSNKRRYLLMAGIFGAVLIVSAIIIVVVAINYQEETTCFKGLKCMPINDCGEEFIGGDITFPCGDSKICCKPKLTSRTEIKTIAERLRKQDILMQLCGEIGIADKIAGGTDTILGEYPWMAILGYSVFAGTNEILEYRCGGTLISDQYILTAAHCINNTLTTAYLGTVNLNSHGPNQTECVYYEDGSIRACVYPTKFRITNIIKHPGYTKINSRNDIALLKLDRKIDDNEEFIKRICLPFKLNIDEKLGWENFSMTGWGILEKHGSIHNKLQVVHKISPWKHDRCTDKLSESLPLPITKNQICASSKNLSEACEGDSGGPLFYTHENYTQVGIISFKPSDTCGTVKQPSIFTRLDGYLDWILDNLDI